MIWTHDLPPSVILMFSPPPDGRCYIPHCVSHYITCCHLPTNFSLPPIIVLSATTPNIMPGFAFIYGLFSCFIWHHWISMWLNSMRKCCSAYLPGNLGNHILAIIFDCFLTMHPLHRIILQCQHHQRRQSHCPWWQCRPRLPLSHQPQQSAFTPFEVENWSSMHSHEKYVCQERSGQECMSDHWSTPHFIQICVINNLTRTLGEPSPFPAFTLNPCPPGQPGPSNGYNIHSD
jgi:hypothetical protein